MDDALLEVAGPEDKTTLRSALKNSFLSMTEPMSDKMAQDEWGWELGKEKILEKTRKERIYKKIILISLGFLFLLAIFFQKVFGYLFVLVFFLWIFSSKRRFQWFRSISKLFR